MPSTLPQSPSETLYREHHGWLQQLLRRKLGCREEAADLAHDTFLRLLRQPCDSVLREPRAYLSTIAHGLLVNHWRRRDLERAYLDALAQQPETCHPSPEQRALVVETLLQIDAMLTRLPERPRQAFLMAQLEGQPYRDIALHLGVSERMVKKYLAQVMAHCLQIELQGGTTLNDPS